MLDRLSAPADTDNAHREAPAWQMGGRDHALFFATARIAVGRPPGHSDAEVKSTNKRLTLRRLAGGTISALIKRRISALGDRSNRLAKKAVFLVSTLAEMTRLRSAILADIGRMVLATLNALRVRN